jgi:hypothetical protein
MQEMCKDSIFCCHIKASQYSLIITQVIDPPGILCVVSPVQVDTTGCRRSGSIRYIFWCRVIVIVNLKSLCTKMRNIFHCCSCQAWKLHCTIIPLRSLLSCCQISMFIYLKKVSYSTLLNNFAILSYSINL